MNSPRTVPPSYLLLTPVLNSLYLNDRSKCLFPSRPGWALSEASVGMGDDTNVTWFWVVLFNHWYIVRVQHRATKLNNSREKLRKFQKEKDLFSTEIFGDYKGVSQVNLKWCVVWDRSSKTVVKAGAVTSSLHHAMVSWFPLPPLFKPGSAESRFLFQGAGLYLRKKLLSTTAFLFMIE